MTIIEQLLYIDVVIIRQFYFKLNDLVKNVFMKNSITVRWHISCILVGKFL